MAVFGLTGGIGSGKSLVGRYLDRQRGIPVVDADALAREVVAPGSEALAEIAAAFGEEIIAAEGHLDRKLLAALVFDDPGSRRRLEAMIHPRVRQLAKARLKALSEQNQPVCCYEAPLLFEVGLEASYRPVVVVDAPLETCIERVCQRDGSSREQVLARVRSQMPLAEKVRRADFVIDNAGAVDRTFEETDRVLHELRRHFGLTDVGSAP